jgi:hypothetical protein
VDGIIFRRSGLEVREEFVFVEECVLRNTGRLAIGFDELVSLLIDSELVLLTGGGGRPGIVGGLDKSVYPTAGTVPSAIQPR